MFSMMAGRYRLGSDRTGKRIQNRFIDKLGKLSNGVGKVVVAIDRLRFSGDGDEKAPLCTIHDVAVIGSVQVIDPQNVDLISQRIETCRIDLESLTFPSIPKFRLVFINGVPVRG